MAAEIQFVENVFMFAITGTPGKTLSFSLMRHALKRDAIIITVQ